VKEDAEVREELPDRRISTHSNDVTQQGLLHLAQLSQLTKKEKQNQGRLAEGLHYIAWVGARAIVPGAVMRGGGCGGMSRLSCLTSSF
jgi:hypothetical protein